MRSLVSEEYFTNRILLLHQLWCLVTESFAPITFSGISFRFMLNWFVYSSVDTCRRTVHYKSTFVRQVLTKEWWQVCWFYPLVICTYSARSSAFILKMTSGQIFRSIQKITFTVEERNLNEANCFQMNLSNHAVFNHFERWPQCTTKEEGSTMERIIFL